MEGKDGETLGGSKSRRREGGREGGREEGQKEGGLNKYHTSEA